MTNNEGPEGECFRPFIIYGLRIVLSRRKYNLSSGLPAIHVLNLLGC